MDSKSANLYGRAVDADQNVVNNPTINSKPEISQYPTEKTFKYANDCSISVGCTPSGFATLLIYIKDTPIFGIGTIFSLSAVEITDAEIFYNSKKDFLLEEDIDPNSSSPLDLDKDKRMHKVSLYRSPETGEYRLDLVKLAKTGIPEIDAQDQWKDFSDMQTYQARDKQIELVKRFTDVLRVSKNSPDIIITSKVPQNYPELEPCVGIVVFKRMEKH
ncbi:hypothetical protein CANINC_005077 [Pichia inconspicua]|uniref:Uncharacterized protein n=1 Tax=Pichia inconspicua TaxID=52247 RepID=A0A4T0WW18_9ASCO|nr:hypothetical protein CANINC_005077 [[Candida] inconspicua]